MSDHLKKYRNKAKQLMREHKGLAYKDAMKKAGEFYRKGGKVSGTKKPAKKAAAKKAAPAKKKTVKVKPYNRAANHVPGHRRSIGDMAMSGIKDNNSKISQLEKLIEGCKKIKPLTPLLKREITKAKNHIAILKQNNTKLKRSI